MNKYCFFYFTFSFNFLVTSSEMTCHEITQDAKYKQPNRVLVSSVTIYDKRVDLEQYLTCTMTLLKYFCLKQTCGELDFNFRKNKFVFL